MNTFIIWGKYDAASTTMTVAIMNRNQHLSVKERYHLARNCERFLLAVDTYLHHGQFQDALKLMLEFRRKPLPTSFTGGTTYWLQQLRNDQIEQARLVKEGSLIRDTICG